MIVKDALRIIDLTTDLVVVRSIKSLRTLLDAEKPLNDFEDVLVSVESKLRESKLNYPEVFVVEAQHKMIDYLLENNIDLTYLKLPEPKVKSCSLNDPIPSDLIEIWEKDLEMVMNSQNETNPETICINLLQHAASEVLAAIAYSLMVDVEKAAASILRIVMHAGMVIYIEDKYGLETDRKMYLDSVFKDVSDMIHNLKDLADKKSLQ